jgi:hypothetical protein
MCIASDVREAIPLSEALFSVEFMEGQFKSKI